MVFKFCISIVKKILTINAPLILKMREIIFLRANYFIGHFKGYFEGTKTFLTPKLSRFLNPYPIGYEFKILEITNIWQKWDFWFADFSLGFKIPLACMDFPRDFWLFEMCFINVLFKVIINLKFYKHFLSSEAFCIIGWCLVL